MQLRNLIAFIHVAELGSFTKAAAQLGSSQSTFSFQIKQLEEELDCHSYNKDYIIAKEEQLSIHFVTNSNLKFAGQKGLSIRDIANEPFVLTEYGQGYRCAFDSEVAKRSVDITPVLEIGRTDMITSVLSMLMYMQ